MNNISKVTLLWTLFSRLEKDSLLPNLAIAHLAKFLENENFEVKCIDCDPLIYGKQEYGTIKIEDKEKVLLYLIKETEKTDPDILCVGCWTEGISFLREFIKVFKERNPGIKIIIGGMVSTFLPGRVLEFIPGVDYLVRGEGEETLLELIKKISKDDKTDNVLGLSYKNEEGKIINNPDRPLIRDLDKLPLIDFENFTYFRKNKGLHIVTSRGCPSKCGYCSSGLLYNNHRFYSPEYVVKQVKHLTDVYDLKYIAISDDNALFNPERAKKMFTMLAEQKFDCDLPASARGDKLNSELMKVFKKARVPWLTIGLENISPKVLKYCSRVQNPDLYLSNFLKSVNLMENYNIGGAVTFIFGFPIETKKDMLYNIDFMKQLDKKGFLVYANVLRLIPGSLFWHQYINKRMKAFKLDDSSTFCFDYEYADLDWTCSSAFIFENNHYSNEEFVEIYGEITQKVNDLITVKL